MKSNDEIQRWISACKFIFEQNPNIYMGRIFIRGDEVHSVFFLFFLIWNISDFLSAEFIFESATLRNENIKKYPMWICQLFDFD